MLKEYFNEVIKPVLFGIYDKSDIRDKDWGRGLKNFFTLNWFDFSKSNPYAKEQSLTFFFIVFGGGGLTIYCLSIDFPLWKEIFIPILIASPFIFLSFIFMLLIRETISFIWKKIKGLFEAS